MSVEEGYIRGYQVSTDSDEIRHPSHQCQAKPFHCLSQQQLVVCALSWGQVTTILVEKKSRLTRQHCKDLPLDGDRLQVSCHEYQQEYLHDLHRHPHTSQHWNQSSCNDHQPSHPEKHGSVIYISFTSIYITKLELTAAAATQTMAIGSSSSAAWGPSKILDLNRRACLSANDAPRTDVNIHSFNVEMTHAWWKGLVRRRRPV